MASADDMRVGGLKIRQAREARQMTQMDVERATAARYGSEGRVYAQQVSRIEKGQVDKPPILDLLRIGEVLGLRVDDVAEMFGLWPRQDERPPLDPRLQELESLAEQAPFDVREEMLAQLEMVVALTRAKLRERLASREADRRAHDFDQEEPGGAGGAGGGGGGGGGGGVEEDNEETQNGAESGGVVRKRNGPPKRK